jgi:4-alpha-glucanotransferase
LHAHMLRGDRGAWAWRAWPAAFRDPENEEVGRFADANNTEVSFHCFLQWLSDCSLESAQHEAKQAGMRVGLVADLAVGMSGDGSNAWTCQKDVLTNLEIGAPPDLYNAKGQNWGLTTFSPRALSGNGFAPFIATLRACLRHVGGLRIDHAMSLLRLWVVPRGADASHGAYLTYPIDDLMRLNLLEAHRHGAILIGEDLGTVPTGFRERMTGAGVYGMRVLWFEREHNHFTPPQAWDACAAAMTSTHDLPTISGWWRGVDIDSRAEAGMVVDAASERTTRAKEKRLLWRAFRRAAAAQGDRPASSDPAPVVDAAIKFIARTPSQIALLPMEDALALEEQPNVPGTIDEFPNWRRRYPGPAEKLLDDAGVAARLKTLVDGPNR